MPPGAGEHAEPSAGIATGVDAAGRVEDAEAWLRIAEDTAPGDPRVMEARVELGRSPDRTGS